MSASPARVLRSLAWVHCCLLFASAGTQAHAQPPQDLRKTACVLTLPGMDRVRADTGLVYRPLPEDDPKQRCPDISLARQTLDWEPRIALRQGLTRTIEYFEDELASAGEGRAA